VKVTRSMVSWLRRIAAGEEVTPKQIYPSTYEKLRVAGLVELCDEVVVLTDAGRSALPPVQ
jgi:hypothetical protein